MSPSGRACPFSLISVGKAVHAHFSGRGDSRALAIENKAIRALPLQLSGQTQHTALPLSLSACTPKMGLQLIWGPLKAGPVVRTDSQPTEVSETFRFSLDCFCFLASASSTATIIVISAASCRRKHIAMLLSEEAQWRRRKPWACGGDNLVFWAEPQSAAAAWLTDMAEQSYSWWVPANTTIQTQNTDISPALTHTYNHCQRLKGVILPQSLPLTRLLYAPVKIRGVFWV